MTSWIKTITLLLAAAALLACSSGNGTPALTDRSGNHPTDWLEQHWLVAGSIAGKSATDAPAAASAAKLTCQECHGSDLLGGVSKVSCFNAQGPNGQLCHATRLGHPQGWERAIQHGQGGAMASAGTTSGFAYCARCHGSDFRGGTGSGAAAVSCFSCHVTPPGHTTAPHPAAPWIGGGFMSHATTSPTNAAVCLRCHAGGNNFGAVIVSPKRAASPDAPAPDCFNNTLCHGGSVAPPHAAGAAYLSVAQHGIDATGNPDGLPAPRVALSLTLCRACHAGADGRFNLPSNNMAGGCETCHSAGTAHPVPWLPGRSGAGATPSSPNTTSHATVVLANLTTDCALCHGAALDGGAGAKGGAPSCLSQNAIFATSCHARNPKDVPGCISCHEHQAYDPVTQRPATGAHAAHLDVPGVSCDACHAGGGADPVTKIGGPLHADGFLNLSSTKFWGRNGGFRYDRVTKTCSNVRCHGGGSQELDPLAFPNRRSTPSWSTGSLTVATDCRKCHEQGDAGNTPQTPQFNSFYSGLYSGVEPPANLHQFHLASNPFFVTLPVDCVNCHSLAKLTASRHFGGLALVGFQTSAGNTPGDTVGLTDKFGNPAGSYDKDLGACSNVTCHGAANQNASWGK